MGAPGNVREGARRILHELVAGISSPLFGRLPPVQEGQFGSVPREKSAWWRHQGVWTRSLKELGSAATIMPNTGPSPARSAGSPGRRCMEGAASAPPWKLPEVGCGLTLLSSRLSSYRIALPCSVLSAEAMPRPQENTLVVCARCGVAPPALSGEFARYTVSEHAAHLFRAISFMPNGTAFPAAGEVEQGLVAGSRVPR